MRNSKIQFKIQNIKTIYESYFLDIIVFLIASLLIGTGILIIKKSQEQAAPIEITGQSQTNEPANLTSDVKNETSLININTADLKELEKLPKIGEKTAQKIIDYRDENGPFQLKEDLKKVSGIGEATYGNLQDLITIE